MEDTTQFLKVLGKRIACLRKSKGMSQEEFADKSGKMINTVSNIERGLSDPKVTTVLSITDALNLGIEDWFNENITEPPLPEHIKKIVNLVKGQDERTLKVIEKQITALVDLK